MGWWLAHERTVKTQGVLTRFDPRFWTVNFPRPMMAGVTTVAADALRVDCVFYGQDDLAGLIWDAEDRWDHPLLAYETARDFRACRLRFRWRSAGVRPLDAVNGPVLTIEGRDAQGQPRAWYVRLWNYAVGAPDDAEVAIDFADLVGGFRLPDEADPVWAGDVDRMFVSLVPPGWTGAAAPLDAPAEGWVELSGIACEGAGSVLAIGDVVVPEHGLGIASGYDDHYHLTPARLLRNVIQLGYRGQIVHYVGMSHYFRLETAGNGFCVSLNGGVLNRAAAAWHADLAARAKVLALGITWSLSYELLDAHCWGDWKQRDGDGGSALTGWEPPSTLLSPAHAGAMAYLRSVAAAFLGIAVAAGLPAHFQVGEPWWWVQPDGRRPCIYDAAATAALNPVPIASMAGPKSPDEIATLDRAGAMLAASTAALAAAARDAAPGCRTYLLTYLPTVLDREAPEARRINMPIGWARPAFDVLQLEDYDWVTAGDTAATRAGVAAATARLGYAADEQEYLAGFVLRPDEAEQWQPIVAAAQAARRRGVTRAYLWALPQVLRDGLVYFETAGEDEVQAFDDVLFPLALGREASVTPGWSTAVVAAAGGAEQRQADWAGALTGYDVGPGVRSEADMVALLAFFRARMGRARAFRLRDPFDSEGADEAIGTGNGTTRRFALVRRYGTVARRITRPVAGSVVVRIAGAGTQAFAVEPGGWVTFDQPPPAGAAITASFRFDVPVRFADDRLTVNRATHLAGEAVSVPLVEVREDGLAGERA